VWAWLTTVDHKRIGILYGTSAFAFFLVGGIEALLIRLQLARPANAVATAETFNGLFGLFTMHGTTMIFLAIMPFGVRSRGTDAATEPLRVDILRAHRLSWRPCPHWRRLPDRAPLPRPTRTDRARRCHQG
jgi:hypothetical protein